MGGRNRMTQAESHELARAVKSVESLGVSLAEGIAKNQDLLVSIGKRHPNVYIETVVQRRRFFFFTYTEVERISTTQVVVEILSIPPIYLVTKGPSAGQFAHKFTKGRLDVITPDSYGIGTLQPLEKALQNFQQTLFPR